MKNAYRRVEAVFDDVARVYRDSAQAAKDGKDPELLSSALCVQLCFEVMEDVRSRRPVGAFIRCDSCPSDEVDVAHRPRRPWELGLNGGRRPGNWPTKRPLSDPSPGSRTLAELKA